jgi:nucleoside-diphosphate-sugar epimerase
MKGNLLSRKDCEVATQDVAVIYHLAAGTGTKSFADAFVNSVVTTRNLLRALSSKVAYVAL